MIKYIAIFFTLSPNTLKDIRYLSSTKIGFVRVGDTEIISFDSPMLLNELHSLFSNDSTNMFTLSEYDQVKFGLPQEIVDLLNGDIEVENIQDESIIKFNSEVEYEAFFDAEVSLSEEPFKLQSILPEPRTYVDMLTEESKKEVYSELVAKLPNVTEWEAKVITLLTENGF